MTDLFIKYMRTILVIINHFLWLIILFLNILNIQKIQIHIRVAFLIFFSHFFLNKDKNKYMETIMYYGAVHILYTNSFFGIVIHWNA